MPANVGRVAASFAQARRMTVARCSGIAGEVLGHRRRHRRARVLEHDLEANLERLVARPGHTTVKEFPEHHGIGVDVALFREHVILEELGSHERRRP